MLKLKKALEYLLYLFVFLLPWQTRFIYQEHLVHGQPFEYGRFSLYASELLLGLIIILGIIFLIKKLRTEKKKIVFHQSIIRLSALLVGLILLALNILLAIGKELALYKATMLILAFCFVSLLLIIKPDFKKLSWIYIYTAIIQSLMALQQFMAQKIEANKWLGISAQDPTVLGTPVVLSGATRFLRSFGSFPHPNMLAGFLILSLVLILLLSLKEELKTNRRNLSLALVLIFLGLLTTLSKAAILAAIIIFVLAIFFTRQQPEYNKKIKRLGIICVAILIFFTASYPTLIFNRATNANAIEQRSYHERINQYSEWYQVIKTNLFLGTGLGNYPLVLQVIKPQQESWTYQPIHNTFLLIIAEIGVIPLLYLIGLLYFFIPWKKLKMGIYCLATLSMFFLMLFDHYWWSFYSGLMLIAFAIAIRQLSKDYVEQNN